MNSEFEKLPVEEKIYVTYRDGGANFELQFVSDAYGVTIDEAKEMIRRCYHRRKESGQLQPYDKSI